MVVAPAASAQPIKPKSASAFRDSVGVVTHIVYYDTAYGNWNRVVARLDELGVRHLREGVYANPAPRWRDWNERYYRAVELAASRGIRFTFGLNPPGVGGGLPNSAGLKGAGAVTQSSSPSPTHTGRPRAAHTWFSTTWSQWPCVSTTATGVTSRRSSVWATHASESIAGSTTHALPPRSSATT
jgi:hypothetical protein